jgi:hypothetical protein
MMAVKSESSESRSERAVSVKCSNGSKASLSIAVYFSRS